MARARTLTLKTQVEVTGADKLKNLGGQMQATGKRMTVGLTLPLLALGGAVTALASRQEDAERKMTSTFESMGAAAWTTTDALKASASALQEMTTFGDEEILEMQSVLLTFGNVTGEAFDKASLAALDMSAALGTDLQSSAIQLGKALNDPIKGVSALSRVGVSFTQQQKDQIKVLTESGDLLGAQTIILGEMEKQFGGTAEALSQTASGQIKQAMNALGDAGEQFGAVIAPMLADFAGFLKDVAAGLQSLSPEAKRIIVIAAGIVAALGPVLFIVGTLVKTFAGIKGAAAGVISLAPKIGAAFTLMTGPIGIAIAAVAALVAVFATDFLGIRTAVEGVVDDMAMNFGDMGDTVHRLADETGADFQSMKDTIKAEMEETGQSFEQVVRRLERGYEAMTEDQWDAVEESGNAWAAQQNIISDAIYGDGGMVPTMTQGADDMAEELGEMPQKGADALLAEQFKLTDAIDELIAFMDQALTPAEEVFNARMFLASEAAAEGIASNNPLVKAKTEEMVAEAQAVLDAFGLSAFNYGFNFSGEYAAGIVNNLGVVKDAGRQLATSLRSQVAIESEPPDPNSPLHGITKWGANIAKTLAAGMASGVGMVEGAAGRLAGAAAIGSGVGILATAPAAGGGGGMTVNNYYLQWEGEPPRGRSESEIAETLGRLARLTGGG